LSLGEVDMRAGHEVLMEVDNNISLIVGNPQGLKSPTTQALPI